MKVLAGRYSGFPAENSGECAPPVGHLVCVVPGLSLRQGTAGYRPVRVCFPRRSTDERIA